ncbi:MAG: efflux RND transporter periplasmic adaptor subunit [Phycisphaeraceae bacterium]|nr:efflux RND transporter periplasmic adaptor subunit [Phycisphaeraceae bacterium]
MMRAVVAIGFVVGVVVLLLWLAGKFTPKVPAVVVEGMGHEAPTNGQVVTVRLVTRPLYEQAVGSIRAVHETSVGSKILARVVEVDLKAGQKVTQGQVLVRLDDSDLKAKFQQAQAAIAAAEARRAQAALDEQRLAQLLKSHAANQHEYDTAATKLRSADADLRQAQETANEVQAMLDYATVRATMDGVVVDKKIDVGDMVTPGQVLLTLFDPTRMQLVASVRESLAHRLAVGQTIGVQVDVLDKLCSGTVSEVVPEAQSASRSFQVKVTGPCPAGIYSGMFGRILIPLQEEQLLVIPREAVRNIGQLQMVDVVQEGQVQRRAIRTGRELEDGLEVLSGLRAGEQVLVPADGLRGQEADHG